MKKKVLVPIADGIEELEAIGIIDTLRRADAEVIVASVDNLQITGSCGTKIVADTLIENCKNEIFGDLILEEREKIQEVEKEALSESKKGQFAKAYQRWSEIGKSRRIIYSTIMIGGVVAVASLAVPVTSTAAALGIGTVMGKRIFRV